MTTPGIPWPGINTSTSVSQPDPAQQQVTMGLNAVVGQLRSLNMAVQSQTAMMQRTINASSRFQSPGQQAAHSAGQPQMRGDVTRALVAGGGTLEGAQLSQVSPMSALTSLESLRAFGAQQLGQWISGMPLYESGSRPGGPAAPVTGGTPAGMTTTGNIGGAAGNRVPGNAPPLNLPPAPGGGAGGGAPSGGGPAAPVGGGAGGGPGGTGGGGTGGPPGPPRGGGGAGGGAGGGGGGGRTANLSLLQRVGVQVAASAGGPGSITNALRNIPGVGLVMDAANSVANTYISQREAGRVYQNVEGGSNLDAQTERLHALAYEASMYGRMPAGATAQAFGQVTAMGYNQAAANEGGEPQNRQSALNFVYHNYTSTGMDVNESVQFLQSASQNAQVNLGQLSQALNSLSIDAGKAGTNAEQARANFNSYFQAALGQGAANGATGVAQGIASMQAMYGKTMAGVNFSGELSQTRQYTLSGMSGMSVGQLQQIQRTNPGAYNQLLASQNQQFLQMGGLLTPQMQSSLRTMITQAGGTQALRANPDLANQISTQFLNQFQAKDNINTSMWAQVISSLTGTPMNANQAMQWIVEQTGGINEASNNAALSVNPTSLGASVPANSLGKAPTGKKGLALPSRPGLFGQVFLGDRSKTWQQVLQGDNSASAPYLTGEAKSGKRNPVLEALLQSTKSSDQVAVQTATGPRVMSMADAMKFYPEELQAGNVEFYDSSGKPLGNTGAITGGLVNAGASTAGEQKQKAGSTLGKTLSSYLAADKNAPSSQTNVTVSLSQEAQQLLKLLPATSDQAAATSTVPVNTYAHQASR